MHLVRNSLMVLALFLGLSDAWAMAKDERPARGKAVPPAAEALQDNIQVTPIMGGVVQGQGQVIITATAQAAGGAVVGPAGCVMIDANGVKQIQNEEYGKKIKITDDPQNGIKIEYTRRRGGSDETKNYEAKDAKELEKKADRTIYLGLTLLKSVNHWLIENKKLPIDARIEYALSKPEGTDRYCYTRDEVAAMVQHCRNAPNLGWLAAVILALAHLGVRIGELAGLRWGEVDLENSVITVPTSAPAAAGGCR